MAGPVTNEDDNTKPDADESGTAGESSDIVKPAVGELTAEEQMALFEQALKEEDWGHQPC